MPIDPVNNLKPADLSPEQQAALKKLHQAATQFEGVFLNMLMKSMRATAPPVSLMGKESSAQQTWGEMLDSERAQTLASSGALGVAKIMEQQLRASVLGDAGKESKTVVPPDFKP